MPYDGNIQKKKLFKILISITYLKIIKIDKDILIPNNYLLLLFRILLILEYY